MSDPFFHYKGSLTLQNERHRYVVPAFELWEERQGELLSFDSEGLEDLYITHLRTWCGVAVLRRTTAVPEGLQRMALESDGEVEVILPDGRTGRAMFTMITEDDGTYTIEITGVGEPPS